MCLSMMNSAVWRSIWDEGEFESHFFALCVYPNTCLAAYQELRPEKLIFYPQNHGPPNPQRSKAYAKYIVLRGRKLRKDMVMGDPE